MMIHGDPSPNGSNRPSGTSPNPCLNPDQHRLTKGRIRTAAPTPRRAGQHEAPTGEPGNPVQTTAIVPRMSARDAEAIWAAIEDSNAAWIDGRPEDVGSLFDDDVVLVAPGLADRIEGRAAVVDTYVKTARQIKTLSFEILDHAVDVFDGQTAVATYTFDVSYELDGHRMDERGQETLVFRRRPDGWRVVWRGQTPLSSVP